MHLHPNSNPQITRIVISNPNENMIRIPVTIRSQGKDTVLLALIDSGAEGQFIHANLVDDLNLDTYQLAQPIAP